MQYLAFGGLFFSDALRREYHRNRKIKRTILRDNNNPFLLDDIEFVKLFRMPKVLVINIIEEVKAHCNSSLLSIPIHIKVLTAIRFYSIGSYQRGIGEQYFLAVGQTTVSKIIREISKIISLKLLNKYVKFPTCHESRTSVSNNFSSKCNIPDILGCIDCTHVALVTPTHYPESFINSKGYTSINVQLVCDVNCRILNVNARYAGSTHDQFIFNNCVIKEEMVRLYNRKEGKYFLIGDSGYDKEPWLMTPILNASDGTPEHKYNKYITKTRICIEQTNGILKTNFRCLRKDRVLHYQPEIAAHIINSCCVLYNILRSHRVPLPDVDVNVDGLFVNEENNQPVVSAAAVQREQELINYIQMNC